MSCPNRSLCVGVGDWGDIVVTRHPATGRWDAPVKIFPLYGISSAIACPSARLCIAADRTEIAVSRNPAGGPVTWHLSQIVPGDSDLTSISCPSVTFCVATDDAGKAYISRNPAGGAHAWTAAEIDPNVSPFHGELYVSCPSSAFCAAVDTVGNVVTSTRPSADPAGWSLALIDPPVPHRVPGLTSVSCWRPRSCVAVAAAGQVFATRDASGGSSGWQRTQVNGLAAQASGVSCQSAGVCIAVGSHTVAVSAHPTSTTARWRTRSVARLTRTIHAPGGAPLIGVSCPSSRLCALAASRAMLTSATPIARSPRWTFGRWLAFGQPNRIACLRPAWCVGVGSLGEIVSTADARAGARSWKTVALPGEPPLSDVACPTRSLCVAVQEDGVAVSRHPTAGASAWRRFAPYRGGDTLGPVACASAHLCVIGSGPYVLSSTNPAGGRNAWHRVRADPGAYACSSVPGQTCPGDVSGISCPSVHLCVAADDQGSTITSTNPAGDASAWTFHDTRFEHQDQVTSPPLGPSVACPSVHLCISANVFGFVDVSTAPTGDASSWIHTNLHEPGDPESNLVGPTGASCLSASLCVVVDGLGNAFTSPNAGLATPRWSRTSIAAPLAVRTVSCTVTVCVAVAGPDAIVGRRVG